MLSFHVKFVQTDRRTTVKQYAPDLSIRGHKKGVEQALEISFYLLLFFRKQNVRFVHYEGIAHSKSNDPRC